MPSSQLVRHQWKVFQELAASRRGRTLDELAAVMQSLAGRYDGVGCPE